MPVVAAAALRIVAADRGRETERRETEKKREREAHKAACQRGHGG